MKLDTRKKLDRVRRFFASIKQSPDIQPFLNMQEIPKFGIYDFHYINPEVLYLSSIQKKLKENKYLLLDDFVNDMRRIFISVSDYMFEDDDFQTICNAFKQKVGDFRNEIIRQFNRRQSQEEESQKRLVWAQPQNQNNEETALTKEQKRQMQEKLELLFAMQKFQNNAYGLKYLGNLCGIVNEKSENNFAIQVDIHSDFMSTYLQHTKE